MGGAGSTETPSLTAAPSGVVALRRHRRTAAAAVVIAVAAVIVFFVVGVLGLFANPIRSVNSDGTSTLQGTFEPYQCGASACDGYVQAGARSVFVQFPNSCAPPARGATITVRARPAPDLGSGSYRATACS